MPAHAHSRVLLAHALAIVALGAVVYGAVVRAPFAFDDYRYVVDNPVLADIGRLLFPTGADAGDLDRDVRTTLGTRQVGYLSFAFDRYVFGPDARAFHAVNIALHLANALLVLGIVRLSLQRTPFGARVAASELAVGTGALTASALFLVHPLQTQAVTYVSQRFALFAALFCLGSVFGYARWRCGGGRPWLALALGSAVLAMRSKENAFALPALLAVYELTFFEGPLRTRFARLVPFAAVAALVPLSLADAGAGLVASAGGATRTPGAPSRWVYFLTQWSVLVEYLRLVVWPTGQNVDWDWPLARGIGDVWRQGLGLAVLAALGSQLGWRSGPGRGGHPVGRGVGFAVAWFFAALAVESSFVALADVIFEHRMYLPMAGLCLGAGAAIAWNPFPRTRAWVGATAIGCVLALAFMTVARNRVWSSEVSLWQDSVSKSPYKARPRFNLGLALLEAGRTEPAVLQLEAARRIEPLHAGTHVALGRARFAMGDVPPAVERFRAAADLEPGDAEVQLWLGLALRAAGDDLAAAEAYGKAVELAPSDPRARFNLGNALVAAGRIEEGLVQFEEALALDPTFAAARENATTARRLLGRD